MSTTSVSVSTLRDNNAQAPNTGARVKSSSTRIDIDGRLVGSIWMPAVECQKDLHATFEPLRTLSVCPAFANGRGYAYSLCDAAEQATDDGAFQSARLTADTQVSVIRTTHDGMTTTTRIRSYWANELPSITDYVSDVESAWDGEDYE